MLVFALMATTLSGCLDGEGTGTDGPQPVPKVPVHGQVLSPAFNPVAGAIVTLQNPGAVLDDGTVLESLQMIEATTDDDGMFTIQSFPGSHRLLVEHLDYEPIETTVEVPGDNITLTAIPLPEDGPVPFQHQFPFDGYIECALEALIITPSCDTILTETPVDQVFEDDSVFEIELEDAWNTVVLDVHFDADDHPGLAGLRASVYAPNADAEVFSYERITQAWDSGPFTLRIDPATDYGDAVPSPDGAGGLRFEFFGHGHEPDGNPLLGVGATQALSFQVIATVFYHEPAPEGWSVRNT